MGKDEGEERRLDNVEKASQDVSSGDRPHSSRTESSLDKVEEAAEDGMSS